MDFNISETVAKSTLIYKIFNKKSWDHKAKKYDY